ncbi:hypothetical protein [uncultured Roseobacter sp.]|uniref:hypothetical protein n=1 Tax=uncultured Roseobacter sp. TaxID=114847 RepID=UPI0026150DF4|nr:hypothetical protein [uncultured Roseobacter sp.]
MSPEIFGEMAPETSTYQAFKLWFGALVPVSRTVLHVVLGGVLLVAAALVRPRRLAPPRAFAAALLLGLGMEALDRRDNLVNLGLWRVGESVMDIARTVALPCAAMVLMRVWGARERAT